MLYRIKLIFYSTACIPLAMIIDEALSRKVTQSR